MRALRAALAAPLFTVADRICDVVQQERAAMRPYFDGLYTTTAWQLQDARLNLAACFYRAAETVAGQ